MKDFILVLHFVGLAMAIGSGLSNLILSRAATKLEGAERGVFMSRVAVLGNLGRTGLGLLVITGLLLMTPYWHTLSAMPTLIAKLTLATLLVISVVTLTILASRAQKQKDVAMLAKLRVFGLLNLLLGLSIVVLAVLTFH